VSSGAQRKLGAWPLIAATYFMVAGGPYGLEEIVGGAGYGGAFVILLLTPLIWSFPTALMVSELASAIPEEGGFYVWTRRAMGRFWGFQQAWLSLTGSLFDMAIYPTLFVSYFVMMFPALGAAPWPLALGLGMIVVCTVWNLFGARAVGESSLWMGVLLLLPFAVLTVLALFHRGSGAPPTLTGSHGTDVLGGLLVAMWNYMGWDNVTTVAGEVERPQRTYPRVMAGAVTLVMLSYLIPVGAAAWAGIPQGWWETGGWVRMGGEIGGPLLALSITMAGVVGAVGTFNALTMSLTRIPLVMAQDGLLPRAFARVLPRTGAPWVSIVVCAVAWGVCFPLGFVSLVVLDVLLTGMSILLEFVSLVMLRIREPELPRPYRVPGGLLGAVLLGLGPAALMTLSVLRNADEKMGPLNALWVGGALVLAGPMVYAAVRWGSRWRAG
jgi:amino acid transporter